MFKIENGRLSFYQWDINQRLIVEDASINEVHFSNRTSDYALVCEVYEENGMRLVDVPNILLQDDWTIRVYAYCANYTKIEEEFIVFTRSKPADYVYTETEIKTFSLLEKRMDELESNVSVEGIAQAVEDYLTANPVEAGATAEERAQINKNTEDINTLQEQAGHFALKTEIPSVPNKVSAFSNDAGYQTAAEVESTVTGKGYQTEAQVDTLITAKLAAEMPTTLPNPNALTFTGAVTGSYDGSEAVTVEIPSGGGGSSVPANIEKVYSWTADGTVQSNLDSLAIDANKLYFCEFLVPSDGSMSAGSANTPTVYVRIGTSGNTYTGCVVGSIKGRNKYTDLLSKYTFFVDSGNIHVILDRTQNSQNVPFITKYTEDKVYIYSATPDTAIIAGTTVNIYKMG